MARFLVYTSPERGHLYPTVPTLEELRRRGHEVAVRTASWEVELLRSLGFRVEPVDRAIEARPSDDWRAKTPIGAIRRDVANFVERAELEIPDLEQALAQEAPDTLMIDTTSWGAATLAEASGLPWAYFAHFPLPIPSRDAPPYGLGLAPRSDRIGALRDALARRLVFEPLERIALPRINALRRRFELAPLRGGGDVFLASPLLLSYTAEPFEYPRSDWPPSIRMVGPGVWDPPADPPEWLDEVQRPLVLVTCSSQFQNDAKLVETALEAFADSELDVAVTTAGVPADSFTPPPNMRLARFVPHRPLLERAACVVCHAGMGITQKALAYGVPVCAVPFGRDQFEVARRVEVAGAGVRLPASRLRPDRLRDAVDGALAKRAGAESIAAAFAAAGGPGRAADALERLLPSQLAAARIA